jgi:hypothetical protein
VSRERSQRRGRLMSQARLLRIEIEFFRHYIMKRASARNQQHGPGRKREFVRRASLPVILAESVRERSDYLDDDQSCCGRDTSSGRMEDWMNPRVGFWR